MNQKILFSWILLFAINKWAQHFEQVPNWFSSYADDLMFLPILLGSALWVQQKLVNKQFTFSKYQIWGTWTLLALVFEGLFPLLTSAYIADPWDILMYGMGALFFQFFQNHQQVKVKL
jgi:hypothetical protein